MMFGLPIIKKISIRLIFSSMLIIVLLIPNTSLSALTPPAYGRQRPAIKSLENSIKRNRRKLRRVRARYKNKIRSINRKISRLRRKAAKTRNNANKNRISALINRYRRKRSRSYSRAKKAENKYKTIIRNLKKRALLRSIASSTNTKYLKSLLSKYKRSASKARSAHRKRVRRINKKISKLKRRLRKSGNKNFIKRTRTRVRKYRVSRRRKKAVYKRQRRRYATMIKRIRNRLAGLRLSKGVFMKNPYTDLPRFESKTRKKTKIFLWYQSMAENFDVNLANWLWARGTKIQLAFEPHNPSKDVNNQPEHRLTTITSGQHDARLYRWARQIKSFGHPVYFRPMSEMNGNWTVWSGTANGNRPADYVPAWRHIRNIFKAVGANNAIFVWSPNRDGNQAAALDTYKKYYPGNSYVDMIGINGYNWGTMYKTPSWTSIWQTFSQVFGPSYRVYTKLTKKPVMICEMASADVGGNKAVWIKDAFSQIKNNYSRIKIVVWFNIDPFRIDSRRANLAAYKKYAY